MFDQWPRWLSRSPRIRRLAIKTWRLFLRLQRATLGNAVLVVRRQDGRVLTFRLGPGEVRLPAKELDGWRTVTIQVEEWLAQLLQQAARVKLVGIVGAPGYRGITFLYCAILPQLSSNSEGLWLDHIAATSILALADRKLLLLADGK